MERLSRREASLDVVAGTSLLYTASLPVTRTWPATAEFMFSRLMNASKTYFDDESWRLRLVGYTSVVV